MNQFNERVQEILEQTNLNWTVKKEAIQTVSGVEVPGAYAIVREDTNEAFPKTMMDAYQPFQNFELIELLDKVAGDAGVTITRAGSLKAAAARMCS
jgi:hypothetical protein